MAYRLLDGLDFDISASAGWYSAIAGLLAGFALLAILLPLDHEAESADDRSVADSVVIFTCAFFTLLILGFSYAALAGRTGEGPAAAVAAHEQLLNGAVFGLASLLLLFGLRSVLSAYSVNSTVFGAARNVMLVVTATLGPLVALSLQFSNALDLERYRLGATGSSGDRGLDGLPTGVWINLSITAAALLAVVGLALLRRRLPRSLRAARYVAMGTLGLAVAVTMWSSLAVPLLPTELVTSAVFEHVTLGGTALGTVIVAAAAWAAR